MSNGIKHVQLEPSAFLADMDYQIMSAEQRGIYCSVILYLYANDGKLQVNNADSLLGDNNVIALLSNCTKTGKDFLEIWSPVAKKFKIKNGILTHKRVTEELKKAHNFKKQKSLAGKKGMQQRYNAVSNADITNISKYKITKLNKEYSEIFNTFWEAYPRKNKKPETYEVFQQINPDEQTVTLMLAAVKSQIASEDWKKDKGKWIPSAINWLKGECWKNFKAQSSEVRLCACGCGLKAQMSVSGKWWASYSHSHKPEPQI